MQGDFTKQKILAISLNMFSRRGYEAVSIRDICREVSIKESSVYYHFSNKRAILNELYKRFEEKAGEMMRRLDEALEFFSGSMGMDFESVSKYFFEEYLMDDFCNSFMRLLHLEQSNDEGLRQAYDRWLFKEPLRYQSKVFALLMEKGAVRQTDCDYLAVKYYAPIFLYFHRYLLSGDLTEETKELFRGEAIRHAAMFFTENGRR